MGKAFPFSHQLHTYSCPLLQGNIVAANRVENAGGLQQQADRTAFPILATLPNGGESADQGQQPDGQAI